MHARFRIGLALAFFSALAFRPAGAGVEGRILGPEGEPRSGTVRVLESPDDPRSTQRVLRVGEDGRFNVDLATDETWIRVESPGLVPVVSKEHRPGEPLVLRMTAGKTVRGNVIDRATGQPLPDATVWLCDRGASRFGFDACAEFEVDPNGGFVVTGVPETGARIGAASPLHAYAAAGLPAPLPRDFFHLFELEQGAPLGGLVLDDRGRPVAGAKIGRDEYTVPFSNRTEVVFDPPLVTDERGEFRHPGMELRSRWVYRGLADGWYGVPSDRVSAVPGTRRKLELRLERPATLQFGLAPRDGELVQPEVRLVHSGADVVRLREAGEDGRFRLTGLPTKPLKLQLKVAGFQTLDLGEIELGPGRIVDLGDLRVVEGIRLAGAIVDGFGNSVPSSWIEVGYTVPVKAEHRIETGDGEFEFDGLPANSEIRLSAGGDGFDVFEETLTLDRDAEWNIALTPLASIAGRVLDPEGNAVSRFEVEASYQDGPQNVPATSEVDDAEGRFSLWPIEPAGRHTLEIRADGYRVARFPDVIVEEHRSVDVGDIHLEPGHRVEGLATRPDGAPAVGSRIWLAPRSSASAGNDDRSFDARTDVEGRFVIAGLSAGFFVATAQHPEFAPWFGELELIEDVEVAALDIEFSEGGVVHGYTRDRDGGPVADVGIGVECPEMQANRSAKTDLQGYYRVTKLPDAQCRVHAFVENGAPFGTAKGVTVVSERESRVDFDLSRSIVVSGVVRVGGRLAERGFLTFQASGSFPGTGTASTQVEPGSGTYRIELGDPGEYDVLVESGGARQTVRVRVGNVRSLSRDFDIAVNGIRGRVVDADGNPLRGVAIHAANRDLDPIGARGAFTMTNPRGRFSLKHLQPGTYRIGASRGGYRPVRSAPIQLLADTQIDDLELVLEESAAQIRGRLVGPRGAPLSQGIVVAAPAGTYRLDLAAQSGLQEDGSFVLDVPPEGSFDVTALTRGWAPARLTGVVPSADTEITLHAGFGGSIAVTLVAPDGAPVEGRALEIHAEPRWLASDTLFMFNPAPVSGPDGLAVARNLPEGSYRVSVAGGGSGMVDVVEGGVSELRLNVE
ncbi:MAG: hypothetical protein GTN89_10890 [Acidobacteria bacterium]|nr:hypothetical protein [Acidobacteriota bacterium]NIM63835.1 hypothetical protein [Acidobacteriota bacterium]NIO59769.1 hypothetical protein [Acidobacteriota bacterium]NIQ30852.1 hypothetical protein [Acidobacteriota bacterium]NIQ85925.1 hypothetical protein [Acidobacteriota bacterium]